MADEPPSTRKRRRRIYVSRQYSNKTNQNTNRKKVQLLNSIQLPTTNKFALLQTSDDAMDTQDQQNQTTTNTRKTSIPPIVVTDHTTDVQAILKELA